MSAHSRQLGRCLLIAAAALLLAACPGNSTSTSKAKVDGGQVTIPGATDDPTPTKLDGGAEPAVDSGSLAGLDGGQTTGTLTCQQMQDCYASCADTDDACFEACYNKGTAAAQAQDDAVYECEMNAYEVTCKSKCTTENETCWNCLDAACAAQIAACQ
jgi:hypothetical protein